MLPGCAEDDDPVGCSELDARLDLVVLPADAQLGIDAFVGLDRDLPDLELRLVVVEARLLIVQRRERDALREGERLRPLRMVQLRREPGRSRQHPGG